MEKKKSNKKEKKERKVIITYSDTDKTLVDCMIDVLKHMGCQ